MLISLQIGFGLVLLVFGIYAVVGIIKDLLT
jgi:hypothetical protein